MKSSYQPEANTNSMSPSTVGREGFTPFKTVVLRHGLEGRHGASKATPWGRNSLLDAGQLTTSRGAFVIDLIRAASTLRSNSSTSEPCDHPPKKWSSPTAPTVVRVQTGG